MYEELANSTLQIVCGGSSGSGFHFRRKEIVVTNHHVIQQNIADGTPMTAFTENGDEFSLELLSYSHLNEYDFAVLRATTAVPDGRNVLTPKVIGKIERGTEVMFSGFPHGIPNLLVQKAIVSATIDDRSFYIDGSVNGGNLGVA